MIINSYLNETGRAGFVMASSGSDAGHSEKLIRKEIIDTSAVDVMVSIGNKFFYSVALQAKYHTLLGFQQ